ncbi:MAG TPA: hypothetical protein VFU68_03215 [Terracidiphilus sp.]|nr:hypothetical protein [Terracidiphilus sp.]
MRWMMIVFVVSVGALLIAAAGAARHVWLHRRNHSDKASSTRLEGGEEADLESEL